MPLIRSRTVVALGSASLCALAGAPGARGQEAIRNSLAGSEVAAQRRISMFAGRYSVRLEPLHARLGAGLGTEYNDNVYYTSVDPVEDFIIRPQVNAFLMWPVSMRNVLTFNLGVGYEWYTQSDDRSRVFIAPGSDLAFDIYVKDFVIELHNRYQYTQDTTQDPTLSGVVGISHFEDSLGTQVDWDLNKALLTFNYDHRWYLVMEEIYRYIDNTSELFAFRSTFNFRPHLQGGLELGGGLTSYDQAVLGDYQYASAGPFGQWQMTPFTTLRLAAGYAYYFFAPGTLYSDVPDQGGVYAELRFRQRLTKNVSHEVLGGRRMDVSLRGSGYDYYLANYTAHLKILQHGGFDLSFIYETGSEFFGVRENFDRYWATFGFSYEFIERLTSRLGYRFLLKESDVSNRDYTQNRLTLDFTYTF